jgi:hypothetical protein
MNASRYPRTANAMSGPGHCSGKASRCKHHGNLEPASAVPLSSQAGSEQDHDDDEQHERASQAWPKSVSRRTIRRPLRSVSTSANGWSLLIDCTTKMNHAAPETSVSTKALKASTRAAGRPVPTALRHARIGAPVAR